MGVLGLAAAAGPAGAATITVTRGDDPPLTDATGCSLRQAVQAANTNGAVGACTAGEAALDTVRLPTSVFLITSGLDDTNVAGDIDVAGGGPLAIVGAGDGPSTIRQTRDDRVLNVVSGSLTLERVVVSGGVATGLGADGFGGGILVRAGAQLTLTETAVAGNAAVQGGGIANGTRTMGDTGGTVRITASTVSGNTATANSPGGMGAGGIGNVNGTLAIVNSTVSGNVSIGGRGGGVYNEGITVTSAVDIVNSTIADNGGFSGDNLHNSGNGAPSPMRLRSTIVAAARTGGNCGGSGSGTFTSLGFNLADDDDCGLTAPTDRPSTDPLLGALAANGGATRTHALPASSPAIDGGTSDTALAGVGVLSADQRGVPRPADDAGSPNAAGGDGADIGAFEFQPPPGPGPAPPVAPRPDTAVTIAIGGGPVRVGPRGLARVRLTCPRTEASPPCRGTLTLRTRIRVALGGRLRQVTLARAPFRIGAGRAARVALVLAPSRVALLRSGRAARRAVATAVVRDGAGNRATVRTGLRLVPPLA